MNRGARASGAASVVGAVLSLLVPSVFSQGVIAGAAIVAACGMFAFAWRAFRAPR